MQPMVRELRRREQLRGAGLNTCVCRIDERRCCCWSPWAPSGSLIPLSAHRGGELSGFHASPVTPRDLSSCVACEASASAPFSARLKCDAGPVSALYPTGGASFALQACPCAPSPGPSDTPGGEASPALNTGYTRQPAGPGEEAGASSSGASSACQSPDQISP